jgi:hypothetical protein
VAQRVARLERLAVSWAASVAVLALALARWAVARL